MQNGKIGVTTENIFPVIKKFLYSDQEIFLRELISNSVDATQKLKTLSSTGEFKGELGDLTIRVKLDPDKRVLTVSDEGIGMTAEEIDKYINQIAFSGRRSFSRSIRTTRSSGISASDSIRLSWWPTRWRSSPAPIRRARRRCAGRATARPSTRWRRRPRSAAEVRT